MLKRWAALPRGIRWTIGGIAVVVLGLAIVWALFVPAADWLARHDVGSVTGSLHETAVDNARGRLLTLAAGLFAAGALAYTARNYILSREGQVTDRYTKAIEQLGSDKLDVRIGGIYALERVARDSARDHPTVMEVLTAFVRGHSREPLPLPAGDEPGAGAPGRATRPDVQAAVTVIGRRNARHDRQRPSLTGADLRDADLRHADLSGADLSGADLSGADLSGPLRIRVAPGARIPRGQVALTGTNLRNADLTGATLTGAKLFSADLRGATLARADLAGLDLTRPDLTGANLVGANLRGATLRGLDLTRARLAGADLRDADLSGTDLRGATLARPDLSAMGFAGPDPTGTILTGAKLSSANLRRADLRGADLRDADLRDADLTGADLSGARVEPDAVIPEGWQRASPGRLKRAETSPGGSATS